MSNTDQRRIDENYVARPYDLTAMEDLVSEFERLLASEQHLLKNGQADGVEVIATAKKDIIDKLAKQEAMLVNLFQQFSDDDSVKLLKERLLQCRLDNRSNHSLVLLELKQTNRSLELLRSMLMMDDLSLYSERGEVDVKREKRRFGSA